tara:strand:- start:2443 stop:2874 length:432 start_codon:yes stop_codon:yes gene_type:complete
MEINEIKALLTLMKSEDSVNKSLALQLISPMEKDDWNLFIRYIINNELKCYKLLGNFQETKFRIDSEDFVFTVKIIKLGHAYTITTKIKNNKIEYNFTNTCVINDDFVHIDNMDDIMEKPLNMYRFSKSSLNWILNHDYKRMG